MLIEDYWTELRMEEQEHCCAYCGLKFLADVPGREAVHDFAWPLSRKGGKNFENTVAACSDCVELKGELTALEYLEALKFIRERHVDISELRPMYDEAA